MKKIDEKMRELDSLFSVIVRLSAADAYGYVYCVTCGRRVRWQDVDAGHWIGRGCYATRYDRRNVHPQCRECNRINYGEDKRYEEALVHLYGESVLDELKRAKYGTFKFGEIEKDMLLEQLREELEEIKKRTSIDGLFKE